MLINTTYLNKCVQTLEQAYNLLKSSKEGSINYEMYRSACIKEFEIILEQSGKLLKKTLKPYFHTSKEVDKLYFKDIFRQASLHSIISDEEAERWLEYRDNRNLTVHDYGSAFAEDTLKLFPDFIKDARLLISAIEYQNNAQS